jgi:hypothetical protein
MPHAPKWDGISGDLGAGSVQNLYTPYEQGLSRLLRITLIALSALLAPYRTKHGTATGFLAPTTGR